MAGKKSKKSIQPGSKLRDDLAHLLSLKFKSVCVEHPLTATTADIFYIDDTHAVFQRKVAVEVKDYSSPLTSEILAKIDNLYRPSINSREIDDLWIVSNHPLAGGPRGTLNELSHVKYSTVAEFRSSLMNFSAYLRDLNLEFEQSIEPQLYIETRVADNAKPLYEYTMNWISGKAQGLMVYGGYGLGKTTFSLSLCSRLANLYLSGDFSRIPIRISLGGIYSKQDIAGLICSALAGGDGKSIVKDFSYPVFLEMNSAGYFVIVLDGFDEMKHAMAIEDFLFTFEQMKGLFKGKAKVVILGRPDSFISNTEEDQVLTSLFDNSAQKNMLLDIVEVAYFSPDDVKTYLDRFFDSRRSTIKQEFIDKHHAFSKKSMIMIKYFPDRFNLQCLQRLLTQFLMMVAS